MVTPAPSRLRLIAFTVILATASVIASAQLIGKVVGVADGDTLTILDTNKVQHKIRLTGIDAPEGGQAFGSQSKKTLSECAFAKTATVTGSATDRYGRTLAKVIVEGVDCNLRQVELGLAWHYKKYAGEQPVVDQKTYAAAEIAARSARRGLWQEEQAVAPWDWRNGDGVGTHNGDKARREESRQCDCATGGSCAGKRGGTYCVTSTGSKRYSARDTVGGASQ